MFEVIVIIAVILAVAIAVILILAATKPNTLRVQRAITVKAPANTAGSSTATRSTTKKCACRSSSSTRVSRIWDRAVPELAVTSTFGRP